MSGDGFLVIDKPEGMTSQQVVARIKRRLRCRKVGHTGTLDPLATGVLPIAVNRATRLIQFLDEGRKVYSGEIELGVESDTLDRDGTVIRRHEGPLDFSRSEIEAVFAGYLGEIVQIPPRYSAIKYRGRPLYSYARAGVEVEIPERRVEIFSFELLACEPPRLAFRVVCSKGTYVRSLAADVGRDLGCGALIWSLRREASGPFSLERAITLSGFEELAAGAELPWWSPLEALDHLPRLTVDDPQCVTMVAHGRFLPASRVVVPELEDGERILLVDAAGDFLALAAFDTAAAGLRMLRVMSGS
ncbi:MAG: tRNA pseudouridine(55) synthase TruB [Deltaproteobacteria bacterium]|nr:tRNA pseudouridine(55) synthase TruB [Deltaproteobacteria bacterium]